MCSERISIVKLINITSFIQLANDYFTTYDHFTIQNQKNANLIIHKKAFCVRRIATFIRSSVPSDIRWLLLNYFKKKKIKLAVRHLQNLLILLTIECFCLGNILFKQFVVWKSSVSIFGYIYLIQEWRKKKYSILRCKQKRLSSFRRLLWWCSILYQLCVFFFVFSYFIYYFMI